jgi:16S rRNA (adenine1518-N6/adenine1519-N6)-dimethyltransferase
VAKRTSNKEIAILPEGVDPDAPPELPPPPPPLVPTPMPSGNIPSTRQTLSFIRNLLSEHGLEPKNKLGQNYLIDLNMLDLLVRSAELGPYDSVLEVGTGTGTLTMKLGELAGSVLTVEIDREFYRLVQPMLKARPNVTSMLGDALAGKNVLNEEMISEWGRLTGEYGCSQRKLIANLPYAVATPIISNLLLQDDFEIERMVVMVQWEIAERLRAEMGTKDYNSLSVLVQSVADVETIRKVGPANFFPRPQVDSAIVCIKPNPEKRKRVGNVKKFREFLRDLYTLRRKNLRSALAGWPRGKNDKAEVDRKLQEAGIDGGVRAEALTVEEHLDLCDVFG